MDSSLTLDPPKKINFGLQENTCNMSCPKCLVHSESYPRGLELRKRLGIMNLDNILRVFDEISDFHPLVSPSYWGEPLLNRKLFKAFSAEAHKRSIPIMINTNGLLIDDKMAEFLVEHLAIISISIDAHTAEVLEKTRASNELERISDAVHRLLEHRGDSLTPRIVVSFSEEEANSHEKEQFINHWINFVDAIRINEIYDSSRRLEKADYEIARQPCREIYDSMNVDFDGTVRMCCVDGYRETDLGNVFEDGVLAVWNGSAFQKLRMGHEGKADTIDPFCDSCDQWAGFNIISEVEENGLLLRRTAHSTYINRLDRLSNWTEETKRRDLMI